MNEENQNKPNLVTIVDKSSIDDEDIVVKLSNDSLINYFNYLIEKEDITAFVFEDKKTDIENHKKKNPFKKIKSLKSDDSNWHKNVLLESDGIRYFLDIDELGNLGKNHYCVLFRVSESLKNIIKNKDVTNKFYVDLFENSHRIKYGKILISEEFIVASFLSKYILEIKSGYEDRHGDMVVPTCTIKKGSLSINLDESISSDPLFKKLGEYVFGEDIFSEDFKEKYKEEPDENYDSDDDYESSDDAPGPEGYERGIIYYDPDDPDDKGQYYDDDWNLCDVD